MAKLDFDIETDYELLRTYAKKDWKGTFASLPAFLEEENRMLLENVITPNEAKTLIRFADENVKPGDGYKGEKHPQTNTEIFSSYNLTGNPSSSTQGFDLLISLQYRILRLVSVYFKNHDIDIMFCQIAQRSPIEDHAIHKIHSMSHDFHIDVNPDDTEERTHSAILFLNDDFVGGKFVFKECEYAPKRVVSPKAGRFVAFKAPGTYHGVSRVYSGARYVFIFWFTSRKPMDAL